MRAGLPYRAPWQPWFAWYGLFFNVLIMMQGFTAFTAQDRDAIAVGEGRGGGCDDGDAGVRG